MKRHLITAVFCSILPWMVGAEPPLTSTSFQMTRSDLQIQPSERTILLGIGANPLHFQFTYTASIPPNARAKAVLIGPGIDSPVFFDVPASEGGLSLPRHHFSQVGTFSLRNIRWEIGDTVLAFAAPQDIPINVVEESIATEMGVSQLSKEELDRLGVIFNEDDYDLFNFSMSFGFEAETEAVNIPIALPGQDSFGPVPSVIESHAKRKKPLSVSLNRSSLPTNTLPNGSYTNDKGTGSLHRVFSLMVIPGQIAKLNEQFQISMVILNQTAAETPLILRNVTASLLTPQADLESERPLLVSNAPQQPMTSAGSDGIWGNQDDRNIIANADQGRVDFQLSAQIPGQHKVEVLVQGDIAIDGESIPFETSASGIVYVLPPDYLLTFEHPTSVSAGDIYDFNIRATNSSEGLLTGLDVRLPSSGLVGTELAPGQVATLTLPSLQPGQSGDVTYRMRAQVSGSINAAYSWFEGNAGLTLKTGVGQFDVNDPPLVLRYHQAFNLFPAALRNEIRAYIQRNFDWSRLPAERRPANIPSINPDQIRNLATVISATATGFQVGQSPRQNLIRLYSEWLRSNLYTDELDTLRRYQLEQEDQYLEARFTEAFEDVSGPLSEQLLTDILDDNADGQNQMGLFVDGDVHFEINDGQQNRITDLGLRQLPYSSVLSSADRSLITILDGDSTNRVSLWPKQQPTNVQLSGYFTGIEGQRFHLPATHLELQGRADLMFDPFTGRIIIQQQGQARQIIEGTPAPFPALQLQAVQQIGDTNLIENDHMGRLVSFTFNKSIQLSSLLPLGENLTLAGKSVQGVTLINGGRSILVRARVGLHPDEENGFHITRIGSQDGSFAHHLSGTITNSTVLEGISIEGQVRDLTQRPLTGGFVRLSYKNPWENCKKPYPLADYPLTEAGTFRVPFAKFWPCSYIVTVYLPDGRSKSTKTRSHIDRHVSRQSFVFSPVGRVEGRITKDGQALAEVRVELQDKWGVFFATNSDQTGYYQFDDIEVGEYRLTAFHEENGAIGLRTFTLNQANTPLRVDVPLQNDLITLTGSVSSRPNGVRLPVANANLIWRSDLSYASAAPIQVLSDAEGRFTLRGVHPGFGRLSVTSSDYQAQEMLLSANANTPSMDIELQPISERTGRLEINLLDRNQNPLIGYEIELREGTPTGPFLQSYFQQRAFPTFFWGLYQDQVIAIIVRNASGQEVHTQMVRMQTLLEQVDVVLPVQSDPIVISGQVIDHQGQPVPFVEVTTTDRNSTVRTVTNATGHFNLNVSVFGNYTLLVRGEPKYVAVKHVSVDTPIVTDVVLQTLGKGDIRVQLVDDQGQPVIGEAILNLTMPPEVHRLLDIELRYIETTNAEGLAVFRNLPYGTFTVRGQSTLLRDSEAFTNTLTQPNPPEIRLMLSSNDLQFTSVQVLDPEGFPYRHPVHVQLQEEPIPVDGLNDWLAFATSITDQNGFVHFRDMNFPLPTGGTVPPARRIAVFDPENGSYGYQDWKLNAFHQVIIRPVTMLEVVVQDHLGEVVENAAIDVRYDTLEQRANDTVHPIYNIHETPFWRVHARQPEWDPQTQSYWLAQTHAQRLEIRARSIQGQTGYRTFDFLGETHTPKVTLTLAPSSRVFGTLRDQQGQPISNAPINIYPNIYGILKKKKNSVHHPYASTISSDLPGQEGYFEIPDLPLGTWYLGAVDPLSGDIGQVKVQTTAFRSDVEVQIQFPSKRPLSLRVLENQQPVANVLVELLSQVNGDVYAQTTNEQGMLVLDEITVGDWFLRSINPDTSSVLLLPLNIPTGNETYARDIHFQSAQPAHITMLNESGNPYANVSIELTRVFTEYNDTRTEYGTFTSPSVFLTRGITNDYGIYQTAPLPFGFYVVTLEDSQRNITMRKRFEMPRDQSSPLNVQFQFPGFADLTFNVVNAQGEPQNDFLRIYLSRKLIDETNGPIDNLDPGFDWSYDKQLNGPITIPNLEVGYEYTLSAYNRQSGHRSKKTTVALTQANKIYTVDVVMPPQATVNGRLLDASGIAVANADIRIYEYRGTGYMIERSDANGQFQRPYLPTDTLYYYEINHDASSQAALGSIQIPSSDTDVVLDLDIQLYPATRFQFALQYANGDPVTSGALTLTPTGSVYPFQRVGDFTGLVTFENLPLTSYQARFYDTDLKIEIPLDTLHLDSNSANPSVLEIPSGHRFTGQLVQAGGIPLAHATLELFEARYTTAHDCNCYLPYRKLAKTRADSRGHFLIENVYARPYFINLISADGEVLIHERFFQFPPNDHDQLIEVSAQASLAGSVRDEIGQLISEGQVALFRAGNRVARVPVTPYGNFQVPDLEVGSYEIAYQRPGSTDYITRQDLIIVPGLNQFQIVLPRTIEVSGFAVIQAEIFSGSHAFIYVDQEQIGRVSLPEVGAFNFVQVPADTPFQILLAANGGRIFYDFPGFASDTDVGQLYIDATRPDITCSIAEQTFTSLPIEMRVDMQSLADVTAIDWQRTTISLNGQAISEHFVPDERHGIATFQTLHPAMVNGQNTLDIRLYNTSALWREQQFQFQLDLNTATLVLDLTDGNQPVSGSVTLADLGTFNSDDQGRITIPTIAAHTYTLKAVSGTGTFGLRDQLQVSDALYQQHTLQLGPAGTFFGDISDQQQQLQAGAEVFIGPWREIADDQGRYTFDALPINAAHMLAFESTNAIGYLQTNPLNQAGESRRIDLTSMAYGSVNGQVLDQQGIAAVANAEVTLTFSEFEDPFFTRSLTADQAGHYQFDKIPVGPLSLSAFDPTSQQFGFASATLTLQDQALQRDIQLQPVGEIRGLVSVQGQPLEGIAVQLRGATEHDVVSQSGGRFSLQNVPYGSYTIDIEDRTSRRFISHPVTLDSESIDVGTLELILDQPAQWDAVTFLPALDPLQTQRFDWSLVDDRGLASWQLQLNGAFTATYTGTFEDDARSASQQIIFPGDQLAGQVQFELHVEDAIGNPLSQNGTFELVYDNSDPVVTILSPQAGSDIYERITSFVRFQVSDLDTQPLVECYVDGALLQTFNRNAGTFSFQPPLTDTARPLEVAIHATDHRGNRTQVSRTLQLQPLNTQGAPELLALSPQDQMPLPLALEQGLRIPVVADLADNDGLASFSISIDGQLIENGELNGNQLRFERHVLLPETLRQQPSVTLQLTVADTGVNAAVYSAQINQIDGLVLEDIHITTVDQQYEDQSLILLGQNNSIDGEHAFTNLILVNGAQLSQSDANAGNEHLGRTTLDIAQQLVIPYGTHINLDGSGFDFALAEIDPVLYSDYNGRNHSHAGLGWNATSYLETYGSPVQPTLPGSYNGGGALKVSATTCWLAGTISADGDYADQQEYSGRFPGTGGSIWLSADQFHGRGHIRANGFPAHMRDNIPLGGSGGRLAIYGDFQGQVMASGSDRTGAGTIYQSIADASYPDGSRDVLQVAYDPNQDFSHTTIIHHLQGAVDTDFSLTTDFDGQTQRLLMAWQTQELISQHYQGAILERVSTGETWVIVDQTGDTLVTESVSSFPDFASEEILRVYFPIDELNVEAETQLEYSGPVGALAQLHIHDGLLTLPHSWDLQQVQLNARGQATIQGDVQLGNYTIANGETLTIDGQLSAQTINIDQGQLSLRTTAQFDVLQVAETGSVRLNNYAGIPIRMDARQATLDGPLYFDGEGYYRPEDEFENPDPKENHHGGRDMNQATSTTFGSLYQPTSSGHVGALRMVVAETLSLGANGGIFADAARQELSSSAGSIWLTTDVLSGEGTLSAQGIAGGRIALYAQDDSAFSGQLSAASTGNSGPGTIYVQTPQLANGKLIVDNGQTLAPRGSTPLPGLGYLQASQTIGGARIDGGPFAEDLTGLIIETAQGEARVQTWTQNQLTFETPLPELQPGDAYNGLHRFDVLELRNAHLSSPDRIEVMQDIIFDGGSIETLQLSYPAGFSFSDGELEIHSDPGFADLVLDQFHMITHVPLSLNSLTLRNGARLTYRAPITVGAVIVDNSLLEAAVAGPEMGLQANTLQLLNLAEIRPAAIEDASQPFPLNIQVSGELELAADSRISASGEGLVATSNFTWQGVAYQQAGHGGTGGLIGSQALGYRDAAILGSFNRPTYHGGQYGGGAIHIQAGSMIVDGHIAADGLDRGAGGSIWIETTSISGAGRLSAIPDSLSNDASLRGGGRIALYYDGPIELPSTLAIDVGVINAADIEALAGAGTLYLKHSSENHGRLIIDQALSGYQPLETTYRSLLSGLSGLPQASVPFEDNDSDQPQQLQMTGSNLPPHLAGLYARFEVAGQPYLLQIAGNSADQLTFDQALPKPIPAGTQLHFEAHLDRLALRGGAQLAFPGTLVVDALELSSPLVNSIQAHNLSGLNQSLELNASKLRLNLAQPTLHDWDINLANASLYADLPLTIRNLTLNNSRVSHSLIDASYQPFEKGLNLTLQTLLGSGDSRFDVSNRVNLRDANVIGFHHGGLDDRGDAITHGSVLQPTDLARGFSGGGRMRLNAQSIEQVRFDANGQLGSGGSIWIDTNQLGAQVTATANGGRNNGNGGGGRIAIYAQTATATPTMQAYGSGSAGTVIWHNQAQTSLPSLILNNDIASDPPQTPLPGFEPRALGADFSVQYDAASQSSQLFITELDAAPNMTGYVLILDSQNNQRHLILDDQAINGGRLLTLAGDLSSVQATTIVSLGILLSSIDIAQTCSACNFETSQVALLAGPQVDALEVAPLVADKLLPGQPFQVTVNASGANAIAQAQIIFADQNQTQVGAGPFSFSLQAPSPASDTSFDITVMVEDALGLTTTLVQSVVVAEGDTTPPSVSYSDPQPNAEIYKNLPFNVTVALSDNRDVASVEMTFYGESQSQSWPVAERQATQAATFAWTGPDLNENQYLDVTTIARDSEGNVSEVAVLTLHLRTEDLLGPNIALTPDFSPQVYDGDTLWIQAQVSDPSGVDQVSFSYNGVSKTVGSEPFRTSFVIVGSGSPDLENQSLTVTASDTLANESNLPVTLQVVPDQTRLPLPYLAYPTADQTFESYEKVPLELGASLLNEDFEGALNRWSTLDPNATGWQPWRVEADMGSNGSMAYRMSGDVALGQAMLISPTFVSVSGSELSFNHRWRFQTSNSRARDGGQLLVRINDTWELVPGSAMSGWGYNTTLRDTANPNNGEPTWGLSSPAMVNVRVDLSAYADQAIQLAWSFSGEDSVYSLNQWIIDDVIVSCPNGCGIASVTLDDGHSQETYAFDGAIIDYRLPDIQQAGSLPLQLTANMPSGFSGLGNAVLNVVPDQTPPLITLSSPQANGILRNGDSLTYLADILDVAPQHQRLLITADNWTANRISGYVQSQWIAESDTQRIRGNLDYNDTNAHINLVYGPFDVPTYLAQLSFDLDMNSSLDAINGFGALLELSNDDGNTWLDAAPYLQAGTYDGTFAGTGAYQGQQVWQANQVNQIVLDLADFAGSSLHFRFVMRKTVQGSASLEVTKMRIDGASARPDQSLAQVAATFDGQMQQHTAAPFTGTFTLATIAQSRQESFAIEAVDLNGNQSRVARTLFLLDDNAIVSDGLSLAADDTSLENRALVLNAGTHTIDGQHQLQSLWLFPGATLTQSATVDHAQRATTALTINESLIVFAGAVIDLDGKGYPVDQAHPNSAVGSTGHAGYGSDQDSGTYGDPFQPDDVGAMRGGGRLKVTADSIVLDGEIRANGVASSDSFGSGGSIALTATNSIAGSGTLQANGGLQPSSGLASSGGRIALSAADLSAWQGDTQTYGGSAAGAGTLFLQSSASSQLMIAGNDLAASGTTPIGDLSDQTLDQIRVSQARATFASGPGNAALHFNNAQVTFPNGWIDLRGRSQLRNAQLQGQFQIDDSVLNPVDGDPGYLTFIGDLESLQPITIQRSMAFAGTWHANSLDFTGNGDQIVVAAPQTHANLAMIFNVENSLSIQWDASIRALNGTGVNGNRVAHAGRAYDTQGGTSPAPYGNFREPQTPGGVGGVIRMNADYLFVDGKIEAHGGVYSGDGTIDTPLGSGGSIWLQANTFEGYSGHINTNGMQLYHTESPAVVASGGRIAIHIQQANSNYYNGQVTAYAGESLSYYNGDAYGLGGAGTVYWQTPEMPQGHLLVEGTFSYNQSYALTLPHAAWEMVALGQRTVVEADSDLDTVLIDSTQNFPTDLKGRWVVHPSHAAVQLLSSAADRLTGLTPFGNFNVGDSYHGRAQLSALTVGWDVISADEIITDGYTHQAGDVNIYNFTAPASKRGLERVRLPELPEGEDLLLDGVIATLPTDQRLGNLVLRNNAELHIQANTAQALSQLRVDNLQLENGTLVVSQLDVRDSLIVGKDALIAGKAQDPQAKTRSAMLGSPLRRGTIDQTQPQLHISAQHILLEGQLRTSLDPKATVSAGVFTLQAGELQGDGLIQVTAAAPQPGALQDRSNAGGRAILSVDQRQHFRGDVRLDGVPAGTTVWQNRDGSEAHLIVAAASAHQGQLATELPMLQQNSLGYVLTSPSQTLRLRKPTHGLEGMLLRFKTHKTVLERTIVAQNQNTVMLDAPLPPLPADTQIEGIWALQTVTLGEDALLQVSDHLLITEALILPRNPERPATLRVGTLETRDPHKLITHGYGQLEIVVDASAASLHIADGSLTLAAQTRLQDLYVATGAVLALTAPEGTEPATLTYRNLIVASRATLVLPHDELNLIGNTTEWHGLDLRLHRLNVAGRLILRDTRLSLGSELNARDLDLLGRTILTHHQRQGRYADTPLRLKIEGQLRVAANARIDLDGRGWRASSVASHASPAQGEPSANCYGSLLQPSLPGSGEQGGGVLHLMAAQLDLNGDISARGLGFSAGGSLWLQVDELRGHGHLDVSGGSRRHRHAGGGRIALEVANRQNFNGQIISGSLQRPGTLALTSAGQLQLLQRWPDADPQNHPRYTLPQAELQAETLRLLGQHPQGVVYQVQSQASLRDYAGMWLGQKHHQARVLQVIQVDAHNSWLILDQALEIDTTKPLKWFLFTTNPQPVIDADVQPQAKGVQP